jgi:hypothetical protein
MLTVRSVLLTDFGDVRCRSMRTESFEYHIRIKYECYTHCLTMLTVYCFSCDILCHKKLCCKTSRSVSTHSGFDYHPPTHQLSSYQIYVLIQRLINRTLATVRSELLTDFGDVHCRSMRTESFEHHISIKYMWYINCLTTLTVCCFDCDILYNKKLCCKTSRSVSTCRDILSLALTTTLHPTN